VRTFGLELERLEREGVLTLTPEQRAALAGYHGRLLEQYADSYDIDRDTQAKQLSLGMRIASFLGALALAASVFFLFRRFWGYFSTPAQVSTLILAALGSLAATAAVQRRDASGYFTKLAAMVAFACFVIDVALLGHIFNITPSDRALLPWAALALLLAYVCELRLLLAAALLCLIAFVAARTGTWGGIYWLHFGERPENFFPAALLLFSIPLIVPQARFAGFDAIYRVFALLALFLPVLVLGNWGESSYLDFDASIVEGFYQIVGFACSAAAAWLGARRQWNDVTNTAVAFFVIFLYTKFYDWWWDIMPKYLFFLVIALTAVLLLVIFRRLRAKGYAMPGGAR
jgi:uncharacterized membrane protein